MDEADQTPKPTRQTDAERRAARLQAALRDNLRRRKAAAAPPYEKETSHEKETPGEDESIAPGDG